MYLKQILSLIKGIKHNRRSFLKPYVEVNIYIPDLDVIYIIYMIMREWSRNWKYWAFRTGPFSR